MVGALALVIACLGVDLPQDGGGRRRQLRAMALAGCALEERWLRQRLMPVGLLIACILPNNMSDKDGETGRRCTGSASARTGAGLSQAAETSNADFRLNQLATLSSMKVS